MGETDKARDPLEDFFRWRERLDEIPEIDHKLYGRLLAPEEPAQLITLLGQVANLQIAAWRGQASDTWQIDSSLVRRYRLARNWLGPAAELSEARIRKAEAALLERFRRAGFSPELSDLELLARLQHHGAATRLLDCTRNAFVALWFTTRGHFDEDGLLVGFRLEENAVHLDTSMLECDLDQLLELGNGKLKWWQPRGLSPRISAQQAVFVFGPVVNEPWGSVRLGDGSIDISNTGNVPGAALILIPKKLKEELVSLLRDLFGFTEESLFPDFDGLAQTHGVEKPFPTDFPL